MEETVLRAKNGDEAAIEKIFAQHKGMIRAIANKFYLVGGDKDDLLQEGMMGLYFAILNFDETKGSFPSFVHLCVLRQIVDAVKADSSFRNKALVNYLELNEIGDMPSDDTPLSDLLKKEFSEKIRNAVDTQLSPVEKQVVKLFVDGYTYDEIAGMLGKSFKSVDGALQRARKKLLQTAESWLLL